LVSLVCYSMAEDIFDYLAAPAMGHLVYTHPVGAMMAYLKLAFVFGAMLTSPYTLYHVLAFIGPAMSKAWRRGLIFTLVAGYALFALGMGFGLHYLPRAMHALLAFDRPGLRAMIDVDHYFSFVFLIIFGCALSFQMPLVLYFVARIGFIKVETMMKHWRLAVMACLILGAMINPTPDLVSWMMVCVPLFLLYLLSLGVMTVGQRQRDRAAQA